MLEETLISGLRSLLTDGNVLLLMIETPDYGCIA